MTSALRWIIPRVVVPKIACRCQHVTRTQSLLHTSSRVLAGKRKNTKKKLVKPVHFKPKGIQFDKVVGIWSNMTVSELAAAMEKDADHVFEVMFYIDNTDKYEDTDSVIDNMNVVKEILKKSGMRYKMEERKKEKKKVNKDAEKRQSQTCRGPDCRPPPGDDVELVRRAPVVAIMGHVDHGKTTLLDHLRHSHIVDQEFGGITQHIGAFSVKLPTGEDITFLDTPGHAAFSAMRSRGAHVTDIVVLVVAADDGVMEQTVESVRFAQEAEVPIIVAINKVDKPAADVERAKKGLFSCGIQLEDFGGEIQAVPISALKGTNMDHLQESILALAEILELKSDFSGHAEGAVIEARADPGRGKLATVLVQRGTLKKGACLVGGHAWARVRGMFNDKGKPVKEAVPGQAVEVIGWRELPSAGDEIIQVENEHRAHEVVRWRKDIEKELKAADDYIQIQQKMEEHNLEYHRALEQRRAMGYRRKRREAPQDRKKEVITTHTGPQMSLVVKGDVDGSVEAILNVLETYESDQCYLDLIHYGVGHVTEHDIDLAHPFNGIIYAFNVQTADSVKKSAKARGVEIKNFNVIYNMIDDIKEQLEQRLPPLEVEEVIGKANVMQYFRVTDGKKKVPVAGCRCTQGVLQRNRQFKLIREGEVLIQGALHSLKHFKNEVDSIKTGVECGLSFQNIDVDPQPGDEVWCYEMKSISQQIRWNPGF